MPNGGDLARQTWRSVQDMASAAADPTVVVPVGSLEQHGPHLPLDTDTQIAVALARSLTGVVVAPAVSYGASGEHEGFAGTISIGSEALYSLLLEYGRSACRWAPRLVFANGHGGNAPTLARAVARLRYEGRDVVWLAAWIPGSDAHAGQTETSLMLHISPGDVRMGRAERGDCRPMSELMPQLRDGGIAAVSPNGVLGDPTSSTSAEGARIFAGLTTRSADLLRRWLPDANGMLT